VAHGARFTTPEQGVGLGRWHVPHVGHAPVDAHDGARLEQVIRLDRVTRAGVGRAVIAAGGDRHGVDGAGHVARPVSGS
jgi:hypothetical protein